jgi:amino acid adenylation domain-containing protein
MSAIQIDDEAATRDVAACPHDRRVHELVTAAAHRAPRSLAVAAAGDRLTYAALDRRASQLAHRLRALGAGRGTLVGICLPRSADLLVAALAVLRAGAAYVPLDPAYPPARLAFMLADAGAPVLVTRRATAGQLPPGVWATIDLDAAAAELAALPADPPDVPGSPDNLAYVIYTSGSSGRPKGVEITHGSLLNLVSWHQRTFAVTASDRAAQTASPAFDAAVWETWPYLAAGASVHVPDDAIRTSPERLRDWLVAERVTIAFLATAVAEAVIELPWPAGTPLRHLLTGGDRLRRRPPAGLPFTLVNNYGPTEGTVVTTSGVVEPDGDGCLPSIGTPIANVRVRVLDERLRPVPDGQPGELWVGGAGLARGYLRRPDLTNERFVPDPFSHERGARLYRTGDLVRRRPGGELDFLGRADEQVSVRGHRIEPQEIAATIDAHPAVRTSAVVAHGAPGEQRLVAYVVPKTVDIDDLRAHVRRVLPDFMVPAAFIRIQELPLTPNGKLDRDALPPPSEATDDDRSAPASPLEEHLLATVAGLLRLERVGLHDNFFVLGGHSLLGAQLVARVHDRFGVQLSLKDLFDNPTVARMAARVEELLMEHLALLSDDEAMSELARLEPRAP